MSIRTTAVTIAALLNLPAYDAFLDNRARAARA